MRYAESVFQNETQGFTFFIRLESIVTSVLSRFEKFVIFLRQFCKITTKILDILGVENRKTDI